MTRGYRHLNSVSQRKAARNRRGLVRFWLITLGAWGVTGCFSDPYADRVSREDERILRVMVDISCRLGVERVVVSDKPAVPRRSDPHEAAGTNVHFGLDFDRREARKARWPRGDVCPMVKVVSNYHIDDLLARDTPAWDRFIATFGGAHTLMRISLPVYSEDRRRAAVYTTGACPYRCGLGFYHELVKTSGGWRIVRSVNAWTS
jgi:hypothetical protein